ncbi:MAG: DEAD/DEAH box helicase [Myxococcaceae bacterium]|nr:DEAD/DEAH box helicase [Myxococcaceae bacterium]
MTTAAPAPAPSENRPQDYVADIGFDDLKLSPELRRGIAERGYVHPTPVQAKVFGPILSGRDVIVRSKTGTGKTAAFGIPLLEKIASGERHPKALILCPTRELALQVSQELAALGKHKNFRVTAIYGGASMKQQEDALQDGSAIIVGTPGRVYDHIRRKTLQLDKCTHAVLDEADEMLNQGFYEEVTRILDCLPKTRQVLLFSATVPEDIERLIARYTTDAETLLLSGDVFTVEHIQHVRYDVSDAYPKPRNLLYMLELEEPDNAIVFCNTRDDTELVTAVLNRNGFDAELLNGDLPQKERERVMGKVKRGEIAFMVATDIAARGIDISDLGHVVNYSLPEDPAVYLHRVGRTGRIGKKGVALNLVSGRELMTFSALEKKYNITFEKREMPSAEKAMQLWTERHVRDLKDAATGSIYEGFLGLAGQLKTRPDADDLIAVLLKSFFAHRRMEKAQGAHEGKPERVSSAKSSSFEGGGRRDRKSEGRGRDREERPRGPRGLSNAASAERKSGPSDRDIFEGKAPAPPTAAATPSTPSADTAPGSSRRPARERKPAPQPRAAPEGQVRMWLNLGRQQGLDAAAITAALEGAGAPAGKVAHVEVLGPFSYVFVAEADVPDFEAVTGKPLGERSIKIERARR